MTTLLRPYQERWANEIEQTFADLRLNNPTGTIGIIGQMPTGAGKTRSSAKLIKDARDAGKRVAFVADLEEAIDDTAAAIKDMGIWCGVIKAGRPADPLCRVQVCSLDTMISRPQEVPASDFVILDECHIIAANTHLELFKLWQPREFLGLTATPERADKKAINQLYQKIICGPSVRWLQGHGLCIDCGHEHSIYHDLIDDEQVCEMCATDRGYLVQTVCFAPSKLLEKHPAWEPIAAYQAYLRGRKCIALCTTVRQANAVVDAAQEAGIMAECLHGGTKKEIRQGARERLSEAEGGYILAGVDVFTQAFDCPPIDGILFVRKFGTLTPWLQAWGRGMRPSPGKTDLRAVDLWGSYWLHFGPELDRRWNLNGKPVVNPDDALKNAHCQTCGYIGIRRSVCPLCQGPMSNPLPEPTVVRQELYDMRSIPEARKDADWLAMMYGKCLKTVIPAIKNKNRWDKTIVERDYAGAWAFRRFLEKFGREPLNAGMGGKV